MGKTKAIDDALKQFTDNTAVLKDNPKIQSFAEEIRNIETALENKHLIVKEYIKLHREAEKRPNNFIGRMAREMRNIAAKQEVFRIAAEMSQDDKEKAELLKQIEELNSSPAMAAYENYIKGLKYLAGMTNEVEPEVKNLFENELRVPIQLDKSAYDKFRKGGKQVYESNDEKKNRLTHEYSNATAQTKARELFSKQGVVFKAAERQFIGDYVEREGRNTKPPFIDRITPTAFCVGKMLQMGHRLEDIMDPRKLLEEKQAVGNAYINLRETNNGAQYSRELYDGAKALIKEFHEYVKNHKDELKTEQDLAMHANTLGTLSIMCFDLFQEMTRCNNYIKATFKSDENMKALGADMLVLGQELLKYQCGAGTATNQPIPHEIDNFVPQFLAVIIQRQMYTKAFLNELQKDNPDIESVLLSSEQTTSVQTQILISEDVQALFDKYGMGLDFKNINSEDIKKLSSMMSMEYLEKNNVHYHIPKNPTHVTELPKYNERLPKNFKTGDNIPAIVTRNDKQIVKTNLPAKMDSFFRRMENKDIRGNVKDNSIEFNAMMESYDDAVRKFSGGEVSNAVSLEELRKMKDAAAAYITAKRVQKGYNSGNLPDRTVDAKMLGQESGSSIFTSRGKERYEFALKLLVNINNLEKDLTEIENAKKPGDIPENSMTEAENDGMDRGL